MPGWDTVGTTDAYNLCQISSVSFSQFANEYKTFFKNANGYAKEALETPFKPLVTDAKPFESDFKPLKMDSKALEMDFKPFVTDFKPLETGFKALKMDTKPFETDFKDLKMVFKTFETNAKGTPGQLQSLFHTLLTNKTNFYGNSNTALQFKLSPV